MEIVVIQNGMMNCYNFNISIMVHKYIKGVPGRGEEVINTLKKLGGNIQINFHGNDPYSIYYIDHNSIINTTPINSNMYYIIMDSWEEIKLPECKLNPFDKVLVKEDDDDQWDIDLYSHIDYDCDGETFFDCIGGRWKKCIPYKGNEDKFGKV